MKTLLILLFSMNLNHASDITRNCLGTHLKDAIKLNKSRFGRYADLTNGKSKKISRSLIRLEKLSLIITKPLDYKSSYFQKNGVPLLCLDFIDMKETPEFSDDLVIPTMKYSEVPKIDVKRVKRKLRSSIKIGTKNFIKDVEVEISKLESYPRYNCMARHLFESLRRSAYLMKFYNDSAKRKGLKSPSRILNKNIALQIFSLGPFHKLDIMASEFQEAGIQILCQDVPAIDLPHEDDLLF